MQQSKLTTRPAPIKGLNAFDGIGAMPEGFALTLRNLFAQPYGCQVRKGYVLHASGLPGRVETVMSHNTGATPKLYAISNQGGLYSNDEYFDTTKNPLHLDEREAAPAPFAGVSSLYDITAGGAVGPSKLDNLTTARWQHVNFPNPAGVWLVAVSGQDNPILIDKDGVISRLTSGTGGADHTVSNIDPALFLQVYSHQKRLWFVEKNSTSAWYLPPDQLWGAATEFNPGINWTRGGTLVQIITWTIDDGNGADDHLAFISSEGEVSVYNGINPNDAATWGLQGVYFAGAPVSGNRVATRYGGDILMLTQLGIVYMSDLLKSTKVNPTEDNTGKYVQQLVSNAAGTYGALFGWQPFIFPGANMVMLNIPNGVNTSFQYVQNDITKAWSEFLGYNAYCWELFKQQPVYGSFGAVYRAWEGSLDNYGADTPATKVRWEGFTTFSFFGEGPNQKQFHMVRPNIVSSGNFNVNLAVNVNFGFDGVLWPASFINTTPGKWDESMWDEATWEGGLRTYMPWIGVQGLGINAAIRMLGLSESETYWASTDWLFEGGGVL